MPNVESLSAVINADSEPNGMKIRGPGAVVYTSLTHKCTSCSFLVLSMPGYTWMATWYASVCSLGLRIKLPIKLIYA